MQAKTDAFSALLKTYEGKVNKITNPKKLVSLAQDESAPLHAQLLVERRYWNLIILFEKTALLFDLIREIEQVFPVKRDEKRAPIATSLLSLTLRHLLTRIATISSIELLSTVLSENRGHCLEKQVHSAIYQQAEVLIKQTTTYEQLQKASAADRLNNFRVAINEHRDKIAAEAMVSVDGYHALDDAYDCWKQHAEKDEGIPHPITERADAMLAEDAKSQKDYLKLEKELTTFGCDFPLRRLRAQHQELLTNWLVTEETVKLMIKHAVGEHSVLSWQHNGYRCYFKRALPLITDRAAIVRLHRYTTKQPFPSDGLKDYIINKISERHKQLHPVPALA